MEYPNFIHYGALGLAALSFACLVFLIIAQINSDHPENDSLRFGYMKSCIKAICLFLIVAGVWR